MKNSNKSSSGNRLSDLDLVKTSYAANVFRYSQRETKKDAAELASRLERVLGDLLQRCYRKKVDPFIVLDRAFLDHNGREPPELMMLPGKALNEYLTLRRYFDQGSLLQIEQKTTQFEIASFADTTGLPLDGAVEVLMSTRQLDPILVGYLFPNEQDRLAKTHRSESLRLYALKYRAYREVCGDDIPAFLRVNNDVIESIYKRAE